MTTWTADRFLGGHRVLDFVNTVGDRSKDRDIERLIEFTGATDWAHAAGILSDGEHGRLLAHTRRDPVDAGDALAELRGQREALHAFLLAGVQGTECEQEVRERVEADIRNGYLAGRLSSRFPTEPAWMIDVTESGSRVISRRLALATAELLAGDERTQISVCGRCSWLFLDPSPSKRRRWCSMATCGNRAKVQRHQRG